MITETPGVSGCYPCIAGTRIPVRSIVQLLRVYDGDVAKVADDLTQLMREQIDVALDYYRAHPARVDEDIARNAATLTTLQARA